MKSGKDKAHGIVQAGRFVQFKRGFAILDFEAYKGLVGGSGVRRAESDLGKCLTGEKQA